MDNAELENQEVQLYIRQIGTPPNSIGVKNVVVLGDEERRLLQMTIGPCEAMAILRKLEEIEPELPNGQPYAHDFILLACESLGARLLKVVIDDLWNLTYYAKLHFEVNGEDITIDARPSDAIALALRANAPIYASETVMTTASRPEEE